MVKRVAQVSSLGRFRSAQGIVFSPSPRSSGYVTVTVHKRPHFIHRLIAVAFGLPKREDQTQVNHIDGNPSNNCVRNLEWCSRSENIRHSYSTNAHRRSCGPKQSKPILGRKLGETEWIPYPSANGAARALGLDNGHISMCCRGQLRAEGGYQFKFDSPTEIPLLEGEEWRDTPHGVSLSSYGRLRTKCGIVSTPTPTRDGYVKVMIQGKGHAMHRLVAIAFGLPRREDQLQVNHKDRNPSNNCVTNLEWVSVAENMQHSYATNADRKSSGPKQSKPTLGRRVGDSEWMRFESYQDAARRMGVNAGNVKRCCDGVRASTQGWEFKHDAPAEVDVLEGEEWRDVVVPEET